MKTLGILLGIGITAGAGHVTAPQSVRARDAKAIADVRHADEAFCQAVVDRDVDRFRSFIADEATFGDGTPNQERGRDAIVKAWAVYFQPDGATLTWKPIEVEVLASGDLGFTVGTYERRGTDLHGKPSISRGNYLTVWRRQPDGSWNAVFDTGGVIK